MKEDYDINPLRPLVNRDTPKKKIKIIFYIHEWVQFTREQSTYDSVVFAIRDNKERLPEKHKSVMADYMYNGDEMELSFEDYRDMK